jgi:integrase
VKSGASPHWIIPAARTKNKKAEHTVPLSPAAVRLIGEALDASQDETHGANDLAVFASKFEGVTTLARHSLSQAVRRIVADNGLSAFTPHDSAERERLSRRRHVCRLTSSRRF